MHCFSSSRRVWYAFSIYGKLCRVTAWILRFTKRIKDRGKPPDLPHLMAEELTSAETLLLGISQRITYPDVLKELRSYGHLPQKHQYASLTLFIDQHGLLRVGGRIQKAGLADETTHPILLSTKSHIVKLLVLQHHILSLHSGPCTVLARLALRYHIPRVKNLLKHISRTCVACQKTYARTSR